MTYHGYLFDTNIAIALVEREEAILELIKQAAKDKLGIYFSVVTECEFVSGIKTERERNALKFLNSR